jgi:single-strand DNA-binding protein
MNKVIMIGNLTRDPELTQTGSGIPMCRLNIAVNRPFANSEGVREADFFTVVVWRNLAETCERYLRKGNKVGVFGSLQTRTIENPDGTRKYFTDIAADDIEFLSPRNDGGDRPPRDDGGYAPQPPREPRRERDDGGYQPRRPAAPSIKSDAPVGDDDLPF